MPARRFRLGLLGSGVDAGSAPIKRRLTINEKVQIMRRTTWVRMIVLAGAMGLCSPRISDAAPVTLQNATATYSQAEKAVGGSINGNLLDDGWGISPALDAQTAVFETATDIGFAVGTKLTFAFDQGGSQHTLGRFRLSVTTDDRSLFADGLHTGGDVVANWVVLSPSSAVSAGGATMTTLGDNSILVSGSSPNTDVYTIVANTSLLGITGIRLEALEDPSLPYSGPGRSTFNGNFHLNELQLDAVPIAIPEPAALMLMGLGVAGLPSRTRRRLV